MLKKPPTGPDQQYTNVVTSGQPKKTLEEIIPEKIKRPETKSSAKLGNLQSGKVKRLLTYL